MANHKTTIRGSEGAWQARCSCRAQSKVFAGHSEAGDWNYHHLREVERVKSQAASRSPSLKSTLTLYRTNAEDEDTYTAAQRALWSRLADEIEGRLLSTEGEQLPLFEEEASWHRESRLRPGLS